MFCFRLLWKTLCSNDVVIVFNFSKKDSQDMLWVRIWKMEFDYCVLRKVFYSFENFKKKIWVSFYSKFVDFFSKAAHYWLMR